MDAPISTSEQILSNNSLVYVFMGPSGVGKSTLARLLASQSDRQFKFRVNRAWRTRPKRPGEGEENYHCSEAEFALADQAGRFLFTMPIYTDTTGTLVPTVLPPETFWIHIYLPANALRFKQFYPNARLIEILPADVAVLRQRIVARQPDIGINDLSQRVDAAETEIADGSAIADLTFVNAEPLEQVGQRLYELISQDIRTRT